MFSDIGDDLIFSDTASTVSVLATLILSCLPLGTGAGVFPLAMSTASLGAENPTAINGVALRASTIA